MNCIVLCVPGDNLLALVTALANTPLLPDPGEYRHGRLVFFDVLGHFMIVYPLRVGTILNGITVVVSLLAIAKKIAGTEATGLLLTVNIPVGCGQWVWDRALYIKVFKAKKGS